MKTGFEFTNYRLPRGFSAIWNPKRRTYAVSDNTISYSGNKEARKMAVKLRAYIERAGYACGPVSHSIYGLYTFEVKQ